MKLIIERDNYGDFYIYRETEKHFKRVEKQRANLQQCETSIIDHECFNANMPENSYMVFQLDNKQHRKGR